MQETDPINPIETNSQVSSFLFARAQSEVMLGLVSVLITAKIFWESAEQPHILYWTLIGLALYVARFFIGNTQNLERVSSVRTVTFFIALALCGILWGSAGYSAIQGQADFLKNGLLVWICCLCFLSTLIYTGKLSYFLAFILPAIGIPIAALINNVSPEVSPMLYFLAGTAGFLTLLSLIYRKSFLRGISAQTDYQQLLVEHSALMEKSQKLEVSLKTSLQNTEEIQSSLEKTSKVLNKCETSKDTLATNLRSNLRTDPITNLSNRKEFLDRLSQEWQRSTRSKEPLTVAYINVDGFDKLMKEKDKTTIFSTLKRVGESIKAHGRRAGDVPARVDKSGFALLLLGADSKDASKIIERVRRSISDKHMSANNSGDPITVHAGVATLVPSKESSPEELFEHVESAAYEAKFQGGNRVINFHAFNDIPMTNWDLMKDGDLNEANFQQKLLREGYNTKREVVPTKTTFKDQSFSKPMLFAVYSGIFMLNVEGQEYELKRGSSLVLPENVTFSAEVISDVPVVLYLEKH